MTRFQIKSYLKYWLNAVDQHALHSPFFFDFYTRIIQSKQSSQAFKEIELLRSELLSNDQILQLNGMGAGSKHFKENSRTVKSIASTSLSHPKFSILYATIANSIGAKHIIELGTSLGINTLYLSFTNQATVTTFEGEPTIAKLAQSSFDQMKRNNIQLITGDINQTLPAYLNSCKSIDFAFLDANHRLLPTLLYFESILKKVHTNSVIVLDDIHQSEEMEQAWKKIKSNELVYGSIDLYRCGIVFFDPSLNKQHVVLQF